MALSVLAGAANARAQPPPATQADATQPRPSLTTAQLREGESIDLDGRLDEAVWGRAAPATDFLQQDPDNGAAATERTEVRAVYDRSRLYLGVICFDSEPGAVLGNQLQRDQALDGDDRFMWTIDTFLDGRSGYFFEINPSGLMGDGLMSGGAGAAGGFFSFLNKRWDGIWNVRVRRTELGWTAEIELPFRTFNFEPQNSTWGINFQRTVRRKNEESLWSGHPRNQGLYRMANAGLLTGLEGVSQGIGLDVKPYAVASATASPGRGQPRTRGDAAAGVDLFYNLTPGLRANLTVNTDFAETEVDQRRVNLTRFPLFFPEQRDFFLDGSSFFDFSREPQGSYTGFFSRRIGLADGQPRRIDYGVKLTGMGQQDIGLLQLRTGEAAGEDFTVLRVKRSLLTQSYVGGLYTRRATRLDAAPTRQTAGLDFQFGTASFRGSQNLELSGFLVATTNPHATGDNLAYGLRLEYPNDVWNARMSYREVQPNHDPAVGFTPRRGYRRMNPVAVFSPRPRQHPYIRRFSFQTSGNLLTDMENRWISRSWGLRLFQADFHSGDRIIVNVSRSYERLEENFRIYPGVTLPIGAEYEFNRFGLQLSSATHRRLAVTSSIEGGEFFSGHRTEIGVDLALRARAGLLVDLQSEWNRISLPEGRFETRLYRGVVNAQFGPWIDRQQHSVRFGQRGARVAGANPLDPPARQRSVLRLHAQLAG